MKGQRGATLIEAAITSLVASMIVLAVGSMTNQVQKKLLSEGDRIEMQQKGRAMLEVISVYARSAGANRTNVFSVAPYTTASVLPIPTASGTMIRLRSDYNENGALAASFPEDLTVSWNSGAKTLTAGPMTIENVSNFVIRYYNSAGTELAPPGGGWDVSTTASHGDSLAAIARIQIELELESRHRDPTTNQYERQTLTSDVTVRNQLTTF